MVEFSKKKEDLLIDVKNTKESERENIAAAQVSPASVLDIRNKIALSADCGVGALNPLFCLCKPGSLVAT